MDFTLPQAPPRDRETLIMAGAVMGLAFLLYLLTGAHFIVTGDDPEFVTAAARWGVPHAPGYPLLTMIGKLFTLLPFGNVPFRLAILTALMSTATLGLIFFTTLRLTASRYAALGAGIALAFTPIFWRWSTQFEVFSLANLLAALVIYLLVRWRADSRRTKWLYWAAFVFGMGLTNQQTIAFLAPAIAWLLWLERTRLRRSPRTIWLGALALIAGFWPYLYVPIAASANPVINWDYVQSTSDFARLVTRKDYGGLVLSSGGASGGNPLLRIGFLLLATGVVGLLAIAGFVRAYRQLRWYFWFTVGAFVATGFVFMLLANIDPRGPSALFVLERFFLLPTIVIAPIAGFGVAELAAWAPSRSRQRTTVALIAVIAIVSAAVVGIHYEGNDLSSDRIADAYARDVLAGLKPHAVLLVNGDETDLPVLYVQSVERVRTDVTILISPLLPAPWYVRSMLKARRVNVPDSVTALNLIEANKDRPFAVIGSLPDKSIDGKYYVYRNGLSYDILAQAVDKTAPEQASDNTAKMAAWHVPNEKDIKHRSFERTILDDYATVPYEVAQGFDKGGDSATAITWYEKSLAIDPTLGAAKNALAKLKK